MAKIALRLYNREIENLIERGQTEEAIAHCKYILQTYPKHIETYRLLGKAFLESQRYGEAADVFQRILASVPDDFVAHVGMSIVRENEGNLNEAIWHMERAFEVQPSNAAVQEELRRLYGRRDGFEPPRIRLTRGALVRMYARGDLYQQAIAEIRAALSDEPIRPDLQVLLARMCFLAGQRIESTEICSDLLGKYPYCYEANRILAEILPGTTRAEDAKIYLQRIYSLDPYISLTTTDKPNPADVADNAITIERMEWQLPSQGEAVRPQWASTLGINLVDETDIETLPEWLKSDEEPSAPVVSTPQAVSTLPAETPVQQAGDLAPEKAPAQPAESTELPEWMTSAGWQPSTGAAEEEPGTPLKEMQGEEEIARATIPDWLQSMAPPSMTKEPEVSEAEIKAFEELFAKTGVLPEGPASANELQTTEQTSNEVPEWLKETGTLPPIRATGLEGDQVFPETEMPEWLKEMQQGNEPSMKTEESKPELLKPAEAPSEEGAPAFSVPAEQPGALETPEALPDWLQGLKPEAGIPAPSTSEIEELPEWLSDLKTSKPVAVEPVESVPEWLQEQPAGPKADVTPQPAEPVLGGEEPSPVQATSLPHPQTTAILGDDEATFAWLEGLAAKQGASDETLFAKPEERRETPPEWVQQAASAAASAAAASIEAVPEPEPQARTIEPPQTAILGDEGSDWLKEVERTTQAETPAPAEPVEELPDWLKETAQPIEANPPLPEKAEAALPSDQDDAFAWLESLAARQGAAPETLFVKPEERTETPPEWVQKAASAEPVSEPIPQDKILEPGQTRILSEELPDWLKETEEPAETVPTPPLQPPQTRMLEDISGKFEEVEAVEPMEELPPTQPVEELPDWLKEAAAQPEAGEPTSASLEAPAPEAGIEELPLEEGQTAPEEPEPVTAKTAPLTAEPSIWVMETKGEPEAQPPEEAGAGEPAEELPDWLKDLEPKIQGKEGQSAEELPEWLRGVEAEQTPGIIYSPTPVPYEEENMVWMTDELPTAGTTQPLAESGQGEPVPSWMQSVEEAEEEVMATSRATQAEPVSAPVAQSAPIPAAPVAPIQDQAQANQILVSAQAALTEGKINSALQGYTQLIGNNRCVEESIHDLRDALYRFPVDTSIWQTLGDAYVRNNRLQDALDAYTKAEELLR